MNALITGAHGLIGSYLARTCTCGPWSARPITRAEVDLTDFKSVRALFQRESPALLIHCAGLTKSPQCQANPALAHKLNIAVTAMLAELAAEMPMIFFSTDLVFDGQQGHYDESAPVNPLSVYGETKAKAEQLVLANPRHTVVRTSLNGGVSPAGNRGFNEEMRRAWQEGKTLRLFVDEFRSPLPAAVTARAVWELAARQQPGLYHLGGSERLSRWQIGQRLAARCPHLNPKIEPASLKEYHDPPRPPDTSLNSAKIQQLLAFPLPGLSQWLQQHPAEPF